jgi:transaldolase
MEKRVAAGLPVEHIRSVASFFVSRVDTNVDEKLDAIARDEARAARDRRQARNLRGNVAIANAKIAYQSFQEVFAGPRFARLKEKGVRYQRPLWASTSTKDPAYPDLYYVEALVAPDSVNTMPPETFEAYRDHGDPRIRIHDELRAAYSVFGGLAEMGIEEEEITSELEAQGAEKFFDSYDRIRKAVERKRQVIHAA